LPNTYFQFKQFTVQQEHCAMKVTTDACLFGAWVAQQWQHQQHQRLLDIGAGTGLLSLMLAQKTTALIDAVEIDEAASTTCGENFRQSPWKARLQCYQSNIKDFTSPHLYDAIITNPPFFGNDLKSSNAQRNKALHGTELSLAELLQCMLRLLKANGSLAILLPHHRMQEWLNMVAAPLLPLQACALVHQTPVHQAFRSMLLFDPASASKPTEKIIIKSLQGQYQPDFAALLKDYYLKDFA
jgi:tRNA1Val (adenine37-N6)-methyltransferase